MSTHTIESTHPEILLVAGEHHKTGQGKNMQSHFSALESFVKENFSPTQIAFHWSAQHFQSADKIPYIGSMKESSIFLATGYFADGLIYGTLAGILVADHILQRKNSFDIYRTHYSPSLSSLGFITKENLNVIGQYAKDLPLFSGTKFDNLAIGEGRIVEIEKEKWGVSRDKLNNLHLVSAICTHMKCVIHWNDAEQTWDCPCHGSRFKPTGEVIEGPATKN